jgi:hypothetical protein
LFSSICKDRFSEEVAARLIPVFVRPDATFEASNIVR